MRVFLVSCLAIIVIGAGGYFFLSALQEPTGAAYTTDGTRINANWSWRSVGSSTDTCDPRKSWQWVFVDFGKPDGESATCSISQ